MIYYLCVELYLLMHREVFMLIKKIFSAVLAVTLIITVLPVSVFAGDKIIIDDFGRLETQCAESGEPSAASSGGTATSASKSIQSFSGIETGVNFYEQLENNSQRAVYNALKALTGTETTLLVNLPGDITFETATYPITTSDRAMVNTLVTKNVQIAIEAFQKDCPEIFWLKFGSGGTSYTYGFTGDANPAGGYSFNIHKLTFTFVVLSQYAGNVETVKSQLQAAVANFTITGTSRYQIAQSIHDGLAQTVTYDVYSDCVNEATGALLYGYASAQGYAKAFKLICDYYNVPSIVVNGTRLTDYGLTTHFWNYVLLEDGCWYAVDCAWDDQTSSTYLIIYYDFFLVGSTTYAVYLGGKMFSESHNPSGDFSGNGYKTFVYPALSESCVDVDYTELTILLQLKPNYPDGYYTTESITAFNNAITAGLNVDPNLEKSQQYIIDAASDAILTAYHGLTLQYHVVLADGSTTAFDRSNYLIYGLKEGLTQETLLASYLKLLDSATTIITVKNQRIGTGTTVAVSVGSVVEATYTVLVYGDVDGDGYANANDALIINMVLAGMLQLTSLSPVAAAAADANHDGIVDAIDSSLLEMSGMFAQTISQTEAPPELDMADL